MIMFIVVSTPVPSQEPQRHGKTAFVMVNRGAFRLEAGLASGAKLDEDVLEDANDNVNILLGHVEGRAEADGLAAAEEDEEVLVVGGLLNLGSIVRSEGIEGDHETLAANVEEALRVLLLEILKTLLQQSVRYRSISSVRYRSISSTQSGYQRTTR